MNTPLDCIPCFMRQSLDVARAVTDDVDRQEGILRDMLGVVARLDLHQKPSVLTQLVHRQLRERTGNADPYRAEKSRYNQLVLGALPALRTEVRQAPDPLRVAVQLAIGANIIDLGLTSRLTDDFVSEALKNAIRQPLHGDLEAFREAVGKARHILYLADNAGEIAVDRLLIEELGPSRITLATRGSPVINDATRADAMEVGLHDLVEVVDNGSDAPGTILTDCSASFLERFRRADLVIAKGQGNLKTLSGVDADIFFLFKVKCPLVVRQTGLPLGTHALLRSGFVQSAA